VTGLILEIVEGPRAGKQFPLAGGLEAGRDPDLSLSINDEQVSRHHARFTAFDDRAVVEDLDSTNGTYVNDQPVHGSRELKPGDRIRFGFTVLELRSTAQVAAQPSAVRAAPPVTATGIDVLRPVARESLPGAAALEPSLPSFQVEETEPAFVPRDVMGDEAAQADYAALASLVDARVKRQTGIAAFAVLAIAGLAVAIFFGVR
jgi:pSer/pThr/pTyr-binding forkhead associated (FHA) protein